MTILKSIFIAAGICALGFVISAAHAADAQAPTAQQQPDPLQQANNTIASLQKHLGAVTEQLLNTQDNLNQAIQEIQRLRAATPPAPLAPASPAPASKK